MLDTILWATDGSVRDDRSIPVVREICERSAASLRIVHVVERLPIASHPGPCLHAYEDRTVAKLKARTAALRRHGIAASLHVVRGSLGQVADHIAEIATADHAQLIIVGTRGRSAWGGATLGSVTQRLLAVAPCPVLVIPGIAVNRRSSASASPRSITAEQPPPGAGGTRIWR